MEERILNILRDGQGSLSHEEMAKMIYERLVEPLEKQIEHDREMIFSREADNRNVCAMLAMNGLLSGGIKYSTYDRLSIDAYKIADAMMNQSKKPHHENS